MNGARAIRGIRATPLPGWVWPAALVASVILLAVYGRHVVFGLLLALAVLAGVVVVGALLWLLVDLALPGRRWAVHASVGDVVAGIRALAGRARQGLGRAPWRDEEAIVAVVAEQVGAKVATLPEGSVAYSHLRVRLHPDTAARLDSWMPIEDVARTWARAYAAQHKDTPRTVSKVSVVVAECDGVPVGRADVSAAFREFPAAAAVALARWPLNGPWAMAGPADDQHTVLRIDREPQVAGRPDRVVPPRGDPARPGAPVDGGTVALGETPPQGPAKPDATRLDHGVAVPRVADAPSTVRLPAQDRHEPASRSATSEAPTVRGPAVFDGPGKDPGRFADEVLTLVRLNPASGEPAGGDPLLVRGACTRIGRAKDQDIRLSPIHVSRVHAEIKRVRGGWILTDLHSTRGTYRNNERIPAGLPHTLNPGDTVEFGRSDSGAQSTLYRVHA